VMKHSVHVINFFRELSASLQNVQCIIWVTSTFFITTDGEAIVSPLL
jgi:hypothetical protein